MKKTTSTLLLAICLFSFSYLSTGCNDDMEETMACPNCDLEPEVGPCNAAFPRYYFDKDEEKCKEFIWGGCSGVVPFETLEECEMCLCNN